MKAPLQPHLVTEALRAECAARSIASMWRGHRRYPTTNVTGVTDWGRVEAARLRRERRAAKRWQEARP